MGTAKLFFDVEIPYITCRNPECQHTFILLNYEQSVDPTLPSYTANTKSQYCPKCGKEQSQY